MKTSVMFCWIQFLNVCIFSLLKACVLYILRVGVIDQMMEPSQRSFTVFLGKQVLQFNLTTLSCKLELHIFKNFIYVSTSQLSKLFFFFLKQMQLQSSDVSPSMKIVALRALSYTLKTLGEVRPLLA